METAEFLEAILPPGCIYFAASPRGTEGAWTHHACNSIPELAAKVLHLDQNGHTAFYACAGYREERVMGPDKKWHQRTKGNVKLVKAFWLDIDVGKPETYATLQEAIVNLSQFIKALRLPMPTLVSSGYGLHVYWPLTAAIMPGQWRSTALLLKGLTEAHGLLVDTVRTADEASILRPPGTHNRKREPAVPVTCSSLSAPVEYETFHALIQAAASKAKVTAPKEHGAVEGVNPTGLIVPVGGFQAFSAELVASHCNQVRLFMDTGGTTEPRWYAGLQLVNFAENGPEWVHKWSAKYPGYDKAETDKKLAQIKNMGPTLCARFESIYPEGCRGCTYKGKITTPAQLGVTVQDAGPPTVTIHREGVNVTTELPQPPAPFRRGSNGLFVDNDGASLRFYPYDLYPIELCYDVESGYEITRVKHVLPKEGEREFIFRSALISSPKDLTMELRDNSVKPENEKHMTAYLNSYLQELQSKTKIRKLYGAMGWNEEGFLLGHKLYTSTGTHIAGISGKLSHELVNSITTQGSFAEWQKAIKLLDQPGLEPHLFSFLVGFGAPLFSITGYDGALLSMLGDTNAGKTLSATAMLSIYGKYKGLRIGKKDTLNAKIEKMAMLGNLPVYLDEMTNIDAAELSQFVYQISEGRGRSRLRSDSSMRDAATWQTLGITSTNASLVNKLCTGKDNTEAELARILEYRVDRLPFFEAQMTTMYETVSNNYGHAGEKYVEWLVKADRAALRAEINKVVQAIMDKVSFSGKERFWVNTIGAVLYGAAIAQALGLLDFHDFPATYARLFNWSCDLIRQSRHEAVEAKTGDISVIAQFLDANMGSRLVVTQTKMGHSHVMTIIKPPVQSLTVRVETHTKAIFIDRKALRKFLVDRQVDYNQTKRSLMEAGVLLSADRDKTLGAGTSYAGGQTSTWWLDGGHPLLAGQVDTTEVAE